MANAGDLPSPMRLFHFSDDPDIDAFVPRPVRVPSPRPGGQEWLNGPLVWAVTEARQATYLFPRDCPRIVLWPTPDTTSEDLERWWGPSESRMVAHVEARWLHAIRAASLWRYELPPDGFRAIDGDWTWVTDRRVVPLDRRPCGDLLTALAAQGVEVRVVDSLVPLRDVWSSSLHASGIRLRHAAGWPTSSG
jgi:hypothetical protein